MTTFWACCCHNRKEQVRKKGEVQEKKNKKQKTKQKNKKPQLPSLENIVYVIDNLARMQH